MWRNAGCCGDSGFFKAFPVTLAWLPSIEKAISVLGQVVSHVPEYGNVLAGADLSAAATRRQLRTQPAFKERNRSIGGHLDARVISSSHRACSPKHRALDSVPSGAFSPLS